MTSPVKKKRNQQKSSNLPALFFLFTLLMAVAAILLIKQSLLQDETARAEQDVSAEIDLPETELEKALNNHKPTVAFYHSNSCDSCIQMIQVVQQVYGEYVNSVALIDVNVYRKSNEPLLIRERINYIPTLVFYEPSGAKKVFVGVMQPEEFRQELMRISGGN